MYSLGKQTLFLILQAFNLNNKEEITLRNLIRLLLSYVCVCVYVSYDYVVLRLLRKY